MESTRVSTAPTEELSSVIQLTPKNDNAADQQAAATQIEPPPAPGNDLDRVATPAPGNAPAPASPADELVTLRQRLVDAASFPGESPTFVRGGCERLYFDHPDDMAISGLVEIDTEESPVRTARLELIAPPDVAAAVMKFVVGMQRRQDAVVGSVVLETEPSAGEKPAVVEVLVSAEPAEGAKSLVVEVPVSAEPSESKFEHVDRAKLIADRAAALSGRAPAPEEPVDYTGIPDELNFETLETAALRSDEDNVAEELDDAR